MPATCPQCEGRGTYLNSFRSVRRCGTCRGLGEVAPEAATRILALRTLHNAIVTCPDRSLGGDATNGLSVLRDREPAREPAMVAAIASGRVTDVVRYLASYYRTAYPA